MVVGMLVNILNISLHLYECTYIYIIVYYHTVCSYHDHIKMIVPSHDFHSMSFFLTYIYIYPIWSTYGIFTYIWLIVIPKMLANIPAPWSIFWYELGLGDGIFQVARPSAEKKNQAPCFGRVGKAEASCRLAAYLPMFLVWRWTTFKNQIENNVVPCRF